MDHGRFQRPSRFALVGAGSVGTAVSVLLRRRGHSIVAVYSRSVASAERAARLTAAQVVHSLDALPSVDAILVGTSDVVIPQIAMALEGATSAGSIRVVHFAGAVGIRYFEPLIGSGSAAAALHPVQACPDIDTAIERLPGSAWGVTASRGEEAWAASFVEELDGLPVPVAEEDRAMWHAAAVTTSNGIASLLALGESMLIAIGIDQPEAVLGPLAAGAVANASAGGGGGATLTGPVVRGDVGTIRMHLEALDERAPSLLPAYVLAVRSILSAALSADRIETDSAGDIAEVLAPFSSEADR
ncbi:MAG: hypothetical protein QOH26_2050 [Actinomycetota bacterium]|jgi:predicted short-subunit dehydrogenase-like oxidoreductase (DUF2520 family)|nr:hypothetical protein [Actinomycetota bacterium]